MNLRLVFHQFGLLLAVLSVALLLTGAFSGVQVWRGDPAESQACAALLLAALMGACAGGGIWLATRAVAGGQLLRREALLLVSTCWLLGAALAGLPYLVWGQLLEGPAASHPFTSPVNCYFEAMSGLTTTGATVLSDIGLLPGSLLLWRSLTHWLGGLGIIVLFVAVLPSLGVGGKKLFRIEAPGPAPSGVHPHIGETARILWIIYLGLTVAEILILRVAGLSFFEATCHTMATLATGGFSTLNSSIAGYDSAMVEAVVIVFMVLAGVNFGLYYQIFHGKLKSVWYDTELRLYLLLLTAGSVIVVASIASQPMVWTTGESTEASLGTAMRAGVFTTVSMQTTTGFCTADFNRWPFIAKATLLMLMFVGGSAGSTGGGIKVIRVWIALKVIVAELERIFRPNVVRPLKVGASAIDHEMRLGTLVYLLVIVVLFGAGSGAIMALETGGGQCDFTTAATASLASLCNIGPGLARVGAVENYGWFSVGSKLVMSLLMALGRLEVFAIAVLFLPSFWRAD